MGNASSDDASGSGNDDNSDRDGCYMTTSRKGDLDRHAYANNPNNSAYWKGKGYDERPDDWQARARQGENDDGGGDDVGKREGDDEQG
eukprot:tig00020904_g15153.t1